jgi:hypothetical protein
MLIEKREFKKKISESLKDIEEFMIDKMSNLREYNAGINSKV